ncbi:TPA: hypothetical protein GX533_00215 [Candidatus Dojkabacteria bacterium]|jgi:hypothetical protein|uniref:Uncharacterized protein n=1 Tax=Candidatus Dojkabacteria bacterium TaxID=2099670 RepID=A0A832QB83_9BACT|nr:hypothetical protein [Candidatus Dojkabacteria bacterium]
MNTDLQENINEANEHQNKPASFYDVATMLNPEAKYIAQDSASGSAKTNIELALTKALDDNGKASRTIVDILDLDGTEIGALMRKCAGLPRKDEEKDDSLVYTSDREPDRQRTMFLLFHNHDEKNTYQCIMLRKKRERPWEIDPQNVMWEDIDISVDEETAEELDAVMYELKSKFRDNLLALN